MNFDNLVEDAKRHGAVATLALSFKTMKSLTNLIVEYIERNNEKETLVGQEPVAVTSLYGTSTYGINILADISKLPAGTKLYTHAQPTPAQIAEIQAQALDDLANKYKEVELSYFKPVWEDIKNRADKLRKGEPL